MRIKAVLAGFGMLCLTATPSWALLCGTFLDPMSVSASALAFGVYLPSAGASASANVKVSCGLLGLDVLPSFTIALSAGNAANPSARYMKNGAARLNYNIYTSAAYASVWGDGTAGSVTQGFDGALLSLGSFSFTAFGLAPQGQFVGSGAYSDTISVLVSF